MLRLNLMVFDQEVDGSINNINTSCGGRETAVILGFG